MQPLPAASPRRTLSLLPSAFAICRLEQDASIPAWALTGIFCSITRTGEELSIICPQASVPPETTCDQGWSCLKIEGPFDLGEVGVLASVVTPLAQAGISVFAIATYDTDYLLVKDIERAIRALSQAGHHMR
jgi:hypothetical protein